jgi:hypothetical protein
LIFKNQFIRAICFFERRHPCGFPEDEAAGLTPSVGLTIATQIQVNCIVNTERPDWIHRIASLVGSFVNLEPLSAVLKHLRHKRHPFQLAFLIKCPENLLFAFDLNPIAYTQFHISSPEARTKH